MSVEPYQRIIDRHKPLFDYTRNMITVAAWLTGLIVAWRWVFTDDISDPFSYWLIRIAMAVASIYGLILFMLVLRQAERLSQALAERLRGSPLLIARLLSLPVLLAPMWLVMGVLALGIAAALPISTITAN